MKEKDILVDHIKEMRSLMERSTRFISLSGLAGISAGGIAILGAIFAKWRIKQVIYHEHVTSYRAIPDKETLFQLKIELIGIAIAVLCLALLAAFFFSKRKAKKEGVSIWDSASKRMLLNLAIPLGTGALFCLHLSNENPSLVAPALLLFYGLALVHISKYTLDHVRFLGLAQLGLGLIATQFPGKGLLFWTLGFGVFHMVYGSIMYFKFER